MSIVYPSMHPFYTLKAIMGSARELLQNSLDGLKKENSTILRSPVPQIFVSDSGRPARLLTSTKELLSVDNGLNKNQESKQAAENPIRPAAGDDVPLNQKPLPDEAISLPS